MLPSAEDLAERDGVDGDSRLRYIDGSFDDKRAALIALFLRGHPRLGDPAFANNQCQIKSREFVDLARSEGLDAWIVWVRRHRGSPDRRGSVAAISGEVEHILAVLDGVPIDFTRRQYEDDVSVPLIYDSLDDLWDDWVWLCEDEHGDGPWRELSARL